MSGRVGMCFDEIHFKKVLDKKLLFFLLGIPTLS